MFCVYWDSCPPDAVLLADTAYSNELPYEYMLALRTTALTQAHRKSLQRVRNRPKRPKTDTESNIFYRIGFIEHSPV